MFYLNKLFNSSFLIFCCCSLFGHAATEMSSLFPDSIITIKSDEEFKNITTIKNSALKHLEKAKKVDGITRIIFVRHGESNSNKEKSIAGRTLNTDLSDLGTYQAQEVGRQLNIIQWEIDEVFSSPTLRTIKTAQLILSMLDTSHPSIKLDERLHEKWYGPFEGASEGEYAGVKLKEETEIPLLETFAQKFAFQAHPEIESMQDIHARISNFLEYLIQEHQGKNILVATHNGVMKSLFMADAAMRGFDVEYRSFDLGNCSVLVMEINTESEIKVVATNGLKFRK